MWRRKKLNPDLDAVSVCPVCGHYPTKVYDVRGDSRRRWCVECGSRWATREVMTRLIRDDQGRVFRSEQMKDGSIPSNLPHLKAVK